MSSNFDVVKADRFGKMVRVDEFPDACILANRTDFYMFLLDFECESIGLGVVAVLVLIIAEMGWVN